MSLDPFEARLAFAKLVRTLNASQQSIQKAVSFAVKYGARCGEDLWDCVVDEMGKATLNARLNILYFLDGLAETSAQLGPPDAPYLEYMARSLPELVDAAVPSTREGVLNGRSTRLILESWRARRVLTHETLDAALAQLAERTRAVRDAAAADAGGDGENSVVAMSRTDILRRIEEDRERQKRLRERIWILPVPPLRGAAASAGAGAVPGNSASPASPFTSTPTQTPDSPRRSAGAGATAARSKLMLPPPPPAPPAPAPLDVEFEQLWDAAGDLDDDDWERMRESAVAAGLDLRPHAQTA